MHNGYNRTTAGVFVQGCFRIWKAWVWREYTVCWEWWRQRLLPVAGENHGPLTWTYFNLRGSCSRE